MNILKVRDAGGKDYRHECGGEMMVDGTVSRTLPVGVGFRAGAKGCVIDSIKQKGYSGCCLKCGAEGAWLVGKGRLVSKRVA